MHATLLTLVLLTAGAAHRDEAQCDTPSANSCDDRGGSTCDKQGSDDKGGCDACHGTDNDRRFGRGQLMPQSCYGPAYGCYPGNDRRIQRYPAFHGNYYRNPYNYRNEFDYPWHAGLHEPTSLFSYNVVGESTQGSSEETPPPVREDNAAPPPPSNMSSHKGNSSSVLKPRQSLDR